MELWKVGELEKIQEIKKGFSRVTRGGKGIRRGVPG